MGNTCSACDAKATNLEEITSGDPRVKKSQHKLERSVEIPEVQADKKEIQDEKKQEKKNQISILTSKFNQNKSYQKFDHNGVTLDTMPDYSTAVTKKRRDQFGKFVYDKEQFEIEDAESKGPIQFQKKYIYEGQWKNFQRNGRGVQQWKDGSIYEGYWKGNVAHGYGRLIHADGDVYIGQWMDDRAFGKGTYYSSCGARYEGEWKEDKQNGYGEEIWPDEAVYKGDYKNGKKHGHGVFMWEDDSSYVGDFFQNNIHGNGTYTWKDGRVYTGQWKNNKMQGKGVFTWLDGRKYQGQYYNDRKEGFGIFTFRDGRIYEGQWLKGRQHGKGVFKKKNVVRQGYWENGERIRWLDETKENDNESNKVKSTEKVPQIEKKKSLPSVDQTGKQNTPSNSAQGIDSTKKLGHSIKNLAAPKSIKNIHESSALNEA